MGTREIKSKWEVAGVIPAIERKSLSQYRIERYYNVYGIKKLDAEYVSIEVNVFVYRVKEILGEEINRLSAESNSELCAKILDKYRSSIEIDSDD